MEVKKAFSADLDRQRTSRFLLGMVVALSLFFGVLELTTSDEASDADEELLEEVAQDLERLPAMEQRDFMAAVENIQPKQASDQVREVKEVFEEQGAKNKEQTATRPLAPVEVPQQLVVDPLAVPAIPLDLDENPLKLRVVEDAPKPVVGWTALMKWLTRNLKYPPTARAQNIQGTVLVRFVVNADGSISDIKVAKSADPQLDREALRVVNAMPEWEPGIKNGKPTRSLVGIPIVFKI